MSVDQFDRLSDLLQADQNPDEDTLFRLSASTAAGSDVCWDEFIELFAKTSCAFFANEILRGPSPAPYNGRFLISEHHREWDRLVSDEDRICVLAARNHGKTFFFDFAYPIWKAYFTPKGKGYIFSATQDQAVRILADIKEELESNPRLAHLVPKDRKGNWSKTQIMLANGHKIYARGYGTKIRGAHPDWIVVDDGLNDEDAYSELVRQKHIDYFYTAITNMVNPGGQIVVVGTPFHAGDLYGDLQKNSRYCFRKYSAVKPDGTALWPERFCATKAQRLSLKAAGILVESLEERAAEIGSVRFARELKCEPVSDETSLFPDRLFRGPPVEQFAAKMGMPRAYYEELGITSFFIGFDFAMAASADSDFTVGFVLGVDGNGNRWVVDIQRHKGLGFRQQKSLIVALGRKYQPDFIYLEANQMQRIFGDDLILETDLPIYKFITSGTKKKAGQPSGNTHTVNKNSLEGGVPQLRVLLENQKIRIPMGDPESAKRAEEWISEMRHFSYIEGKLQGVGSHDDTVMAFWIANCAARLGSMTLDLDMDDAESLDDIIAELTAEAPAQEWGDDPVADLLGQWDGPEEIEDAPLSVVRDFFTTAMREVKATRVEVRVPQPWEDLEAEDDGGDSFFFGADAFPSFPGVPPG